MRKHRRVAAALFLGIVGTACGSAVGAESTSAVAASRPSAKAGRSPVGSRPARARDFARWEKEISSFERTDRESPPKKGGVLFLGSSTIKRWRTLEKDFPRHIVINRGFGGSEIVDSTHFAERIIFPYEPQTILLRAGGNDIHAGKKASEVFADYQAFVKTVHARLPKTRIVFIGLCPAPVRWDERQENRKLNDLVKEWSRGRDHLAYIETYSMSLTKEGQPREDLFVADRLHFNAEGYRILADLVRPFLPETK